MQAEIDHAMHMADSAQQTANQAMQMAKHNQSILDQSIFQQSE
jgi:hypothetical protein